MVAGSILLRRAPVQAVLRSLLPLLFLSSITLQPQAVAQSTGSNVALTYVAGSTVKVEQVIGDCDWQVQAKDGTCLRTASQTVTRFNILGNGQGGSFESNGKMIFWFGDTISQNPTTVNFHAGDPVAWSTSTDPEAGLLLSFYTNSDGTPLFVKPPGVAMGGYDIPNSGISLSDGIYFVCNLGADTNLSDNHANSYSMLVRFDESTQSFTAGRTISRLPGGHFVFTALHASGSDVLMFGAGNYRASDVYLSKTPANTFASGVGTLYFAGLVNGQPTWSTRESDAVPVVQDNPLSGPVWPNDSPSVGNMSVIYSNDLKLWLMSYDGGRQSGVTKGDYFTYAQQPWGPWATPQLIFNIVRDHADGVFIHDPDIVPNPPGDGLNGPTIGDIDPYTTVGGAFAPLMIERFTRVVGDTLKIYYNISTWNPYTVVRMRSEFHITQERSFTVSNRGGTSVTSSGTGNSTSVGYGRIQPDSGNSAPAGVAIFGNRQNNVLVSEVGVPAVPAITSGRIYAEIGGVVDAGVAIANPNSSTATLNFFFTDGTGNRAGSGTTTIPPNQQIARFLHEPPFNVYRTTTFQGTFTFTSDEPVAAIALRGLTNERGEFLMSTLPVIDLDAPPNNGPAVIPHFADGGGWTTQVLLVNPTDDPMTGTVQFLGPTGAAANVTIGGQTSSSFSYSIPRRTSQKLSTSGFASTTASGSIPIIPANGGPGPTSLIVFSYKPAGITVSEAGVPVARSSAFRAYVETAGGLGAISSIDSGIAVANTSSAAANVTFDLTDLTGATISGITPVIVPLPGNGQTAKFLSELFPSLAKPFKGLLRITTTSPGVSVVALRTRVNERGDFLITTTPPANENSPTTVAEVFFPQVADGAGYTTQFILFSGTAGQAASGILKLVKQDGSPFALTLN
jgi:hypothetical protein